MRPWLILVVITAACGIDSAPFSGGTGGDGGSIAGSELPCEVQDALEASCQGCHGSPLANGAPLRLMTRADLTRHVASGETVAERCVARMRAAQNPMPPPPASPAPDPDVAAIESWIAAGMPKGDCAPGPFDVPATCTSNQFWTFGDEESPRMHPGYACIACHTAEREGPRFGAAGTVFPTGHEPDDCFGASGGITVEITDATNVVRTLPVNSAGNFFFEGTLAFPIRAKVISGAGERAMAGAVASGDCNSCHTQDGTMQAPGRIVAP